MTAAGRALLRRARGGHVGPFDRGAGPLLERHRGGGPPTYGKVMLNTEAMSRRAPSGAAALSLTGSYEDSTRSTDEHC